MPDERTDWPRLLSLLVHELRTPVNVALGYLRMLLDARTGPSDERQRTMLEHATRAVDAIAALLGEASELARLERADEQLSARRGDLGALAREAAEAFVPPPRSQVTVECRSLATATPIDADLDRLQRAVVACIAALVHELPDEGRLVLETAGQDQDIVVLCLGEARRLESLPRGDAAWGPLDEWRGGVGLGLAVARRVVARSGGRLQSPRLETRVPAVRFVLPRAR
jgi:signal transduction histidine kinase